MKNIRVATLDHININELTEIWNRCWRGYFYDMSFTPEHMRGWLDLSQVSLHHSMSILVEEKIVGFALLSIEGTEGWIAGACIDPEYRRKGLFTALMRIEIDVVRRAGLERVYLEVLEQNQARKIYQSIGFEQLRQLNIYRIQNKLNCSTRIVETPSLELIPIEMYFDYRRAIFNPAWQRREGYLQRHGNVSAVMNSTGTAGALFAGENNALLLDAWSTTVAGAKEVISSDILRSGVSWSLTNQPEDQIVTILSNRGIYPTAKQYEMCLDLTYF